MITGSIVAIVSPMHEDGSLDLDRYRALIDWHVESGTAAIVAVGTTGESPTVDVAEHVSLIRVAVEPRKTRASRGSVELEPMTSTSQTMHSMVTALSRAA